MNLHWRELGRHQSRFGMSTAIAIFHDPVRGSIIALGSRNVAIFGLEIGPTVVELEKVCWETGDAYSVDDLCFIEGVEGGWFLAAAYRGRGLAIWRSDGVLISQIENPLLGSALGGFGCVLPISLVGRPAVLAGGEDLLLAVELPSGRIARIVQQAGSVDRLARTWSHGRSVIVGAGRHEVRLWDAVSLEPQDVAWPVPDPVVSLSATQMNGKALVALGCGDTTVTMWNPEVGAALWGPLPMHVGESQQVELTEFASAPDGTPVLVTAGSDNYLRTVDPMTAQEIAPPISVSDVGAVRECVVNGRAIFVHTEYDQVVFRELCED
ncbi:MAG: WD40 repeat domain-containing protein [Kineosporiaceae bacterium]|nr:WD40 repeat domain-containing protein [Kineosporiaceae bacterium]